MLDRDFEALAIEVFEIGFQIRISRPRIMLNPYFQLTRRKIADFKRNCCFLNHPEGIAKIQLKMGYMELWSIYLYQILKNNQ